MKYGVLTALDVLFEMHFVSHPYIFSALKINFESSIESCFTYMSSLNSKPMMEDF